MMADQEDAAQARTRDLNEESTRRRAALLSLPYFDTRGVAAAATLLPNILTITEMRQGRIIPLVDGNEEKPLIFGITIATPQQLLRQLRSRFENRQVQFAMISEDGFKEFMLRYDPPQQVVYEDVKIAKHGDSDTIAQVSQTLESVRSDDVVNYLVTQADTLGASDIHIESQRTGMRIRFRIDGVLHPIANLSQDKYRVIYGALATRANISTAAQEAQTGHMQQEVQRPDGTTRQLNMRIETIPTIYGQDAVIRLFNFDPSILDLKKLGLSDEQRKNIEEIISHPHGMAFVVGPTGSGKSTTLYSILNALNDPERKLLTLEDPVELALPGVSQIPVNTGGGASFADALRAVLRLDPDVVMVGEIRDVDTARTAIQASITGHLVLSTFHANDAASAFSRMVDMIGQNPIFAGAIRLVIAQRLVRRLDDATKVAYKPDAATLQFIKKELADLPPNVKKPDFENLKLYKPGASAQNPFGFSGRIVLMEQMIVSDKIQAYLRGDITEVNAPAILKTAQKEGMVTLLQDGLLKACAGATTLEEVNRTI